jgi:predicted negative regulator of RcsB-dependent stress response
MRKSKIPIDFLCHTGHFFIRHMSDPSTHPLPIGEIVQGPSPFEQFLENNQKWLAISAVATALGIGGFMVYRTVEKDNAIAAGVAFSSAQDIASLEKVKVDYAGTPSAVTAALAIAEKLWSNGQEDEAIATLKEIIEKFPKHPATIVAQNTLGYRLLSQGKTGDATLAFQAVLDRDAANFLAPAATIALGDIAKQAGDLGKAAELYKSVSKDFSDSPFATMAAEREKFLTFTPPVEIEAPPAAPETPLISQPDSTPGSDTPTGNPLLDSFNTPGTTPPSETPSPEESPTAPTTPP